MENYRIKVLKDTPIDKANTTLSIPEFRERYSYIINKDNSDKFLIDFINGCHSDNSLYSEYRVANWFEVINLTPTFKIGEYVWNEDTSQAYFIVDYISTGVNWKPNYTSFSAANTYKDVYKRLATCDEIANYRLIEYCDGKVLVGKYTSWYHDSKIWRKLTNVYDVVLHYMKCTYSKSVNTMNVNEKDIYQNYTVAQNGLKIGCLIVSHEEILKIADQLDIRVKDYDLYKK